MPSYTLAELQLQVYDELDDNVPFFPLAQVTAALNEGLCRLNCLIGFNQGILPLNGTAGDFTVAGQLIYQVPPGMMIPICIYCEGRELEKRSFRELATAFRYWAVETTATAGPVAHWVPIGISSFVIHPIDSQGGRLLEVQGVLPVPLLVNNNDVVDLDDQWVDIIIDYARMRVLLKDSTAIFSLVSGEVYPEFIRKLKTAMIWDDMQFPRYFVESQLQKNEAVGVK